MRDKWRERLIDCLELLTAVFPQSSANWARAMLAEATLAGNSQEFLFWMAGVVQVGIRQSVRESLTLERPLGISLACLWFTTFSACLFLRTLFQLPQIHEPWTQAWFPFVACLAITLVPAGIAFGLWTCDNLARRLSVAFAFLDLGIALRYFAVVGSSPFRVWKIAGDLTVLVLMFTPAVRAACRWPKSDEPILRLRQ